MFLYERLIYLAIFSGILYRYVTKNLHDAWTWCMFYKKNTFFSTSLIVTHDNGSNNRQVYGGIRLLDPYSMEP